MHRQIVESELHACTVELNYLQSEMVKTAAEVSARGIVYDKLTECERILSGVPLLYGDYVNMIDFKSLARDLDREGGRDSQEKEVMDTVIPFAAAGRS